MSGGGGGLCELLFCEEFLLKMIRSKQGRTLQLRFIRVRVRER